MGYVEQLDETLEEVDEESQHIEVKTTKETQTEVFKMSIGIQTEYNIISGTLKLNLIVFGRRKGSKKANQLILFGHIE